ncbi:Uncharacterised protein [Mycobacteroides abscessus subsp. abscessus]|nr:Uncharacterised protein [Mycobacteroides abscessus subsp. abscessus]
MENGRPQSGSDWNRRISSGSLVCHSEPETGWPAATNGALNSARLAPKYSLGAIACSPVANTFSWRIASR